MGAIDSDPVIDDEVDALINSKVTKPKVTKVTPSVEDQLEEFEVEDDLE